MDIDVIVERKSFDVELEVGNPVVEVKAPDHHNGPFDIFPSDEDQIIPVKEKMPVEDICVKGAEGSLEITSNGIYEVVGKAFVNVDIPTTGYDKGTLIYEGDFSSVTNQWAVTELPNGQPFAVDKLVVEFTNMGDGYNSGWRQYWRSDLPMTGNVPYLLNTGVGFLRNATDLKSISEFIMDDTYITAVSVGYDCDNPTNITANTARKAHDGYGKITAYGWWSWYCPAEAHIKIMGYNRIGDE